jgi:hypothetical protein
MSTASLALSFTVARLAAREPPPDVFYLAADQRSRPAWSAEPGREEI